MDQQPDSFDNDFQWEPQPAAARLVAALVEDFLQQNEFAANLAIRMRDETGTRFVDWVDHISVGHSDTAAKSLAELGFEPGYGGEPFFWRHPAGMFPRIVAQGEERIRCAIRVESVVDFLAAHDFAIHELIEGTAVAPMRRWCISESGSSEFWIVERHSAVGWDEMREDSFDVSAIENHARSFHDRGRDFADAAEGFRHASDLIATAVNDVGVDRACDLFFTAEREYWQVRNRAARAQKARQDKLGLGWANHDHHTYRSSREHFAALIGLFEQLGCQCRERFYAGEEAGWGAQVLEQRVARIVIFADVDLTPEEVSGDFSHHGLSSAQQLHTVGLWCRLHGEAFLQAGMHHLECQFDFARVQQQLGEQGIETMAPFTDFDYLKQAFTAGEVWPVAVDRIKQLAADGFINEDQAERFRVEGALGSHLEILQRDDGYKGFNQTGISEIIRKTDPRAS
jgi:hypothetical protein